MHQSSRPQTSPVRPTVASASFARPHPHSSHGTRAPAPTLSEHVHVHPSKAHKALESAESDRGTHQSAPVHVHCNSAAGLPPDPSGCAGGGDTGNEGEGDGGGEGKARGAGGGHREVWSPLPRDIPGYYQTAQTTNGRSHGPAAAVDATSLAAQVIAALPRLPSLESPALHSGLDEREGETGGERECGEGGRKLGERERVCCVCTRVSMNFVENGLFCAHHTCTCTHACTKVHTPSQPPILSCLSPPPTQPPLLSSLYSSLCDTV